MASRLLFQGPAVRDMPPEWPRIISSRLLALFFVPLPENEATTITTTTTTTKRQQQQYVSFFLPFLLLFPVLFLCLFLFIFLFLFPFFESCFLSLPLSLRLSLPFSRPLSLLLSLSLFPCLFLFLFLLPTTPTTTLHDLCSFEPSGLRACWPAGGRQPLKSLYPWTLLHRRFVGSTFRPPNLDIFKTVEE